MYQWKILTALFCLLASQVAFSDVAPQAAAESSRPMLVKLDATRAFFPLGYDDNDLIDITVDGILPNGCYRAGALHAKVDEANHAIYLTQEGYVVTGTICPQTTEPFHRTVNIHPLRTGQYDLWLELQSTGTDDQKMWKSLGTLPVKIATTANMDDFPYANVEAARVEKSDNNDNSDKGEVQVGKNYKVILRGVLKNSCVNLAPENVRVIFHANNTIDVLPILDEKKGFICAQALKPYEINVDLKNVVEGRYLIYVRSVSGVAHNIVRNL